MFLNLPQGRFYHMLNSLLLRLQKSKNLRRLNDLFSQLYSTVPKSSPKPPPKSSTISAPKLLSNSPQINPLKRKSIEVTKYSLTKKSSMNTPCLNSSEILLQPQKALNTELSVSISTSSKTLEKMNFSSKDADQEVQTVTRVSNILSYLNSFPTSNTSPIKFNTQTHQNSLLNSNLTKAIPVPSPSILNIENQNSSNMPVVIDLISDDDEVTEVFPFRKEEEKLPHKLVQPISPINKTSLFIPRPKILTQPKCLQIPKLPAKRSRNESNENAICFLCKWRFPICFEDIEKQRHINRCIDGKGKEDIIEYRKSEKEIRRIRKQDGIRDNETEGKDRPTYKKCPYCLEVLASISDDYLEEHLRICKERTLVSELRSQDIDIYSSVEATDNIEFKRFKRMTSMNQSPN